MTAGAAAVVQAEGVAVAAPKSKFSTPTLSCDFATQVGLDIKVCAGATGAPAGFSLQWMTADEYAANGNAWYLSSDPRLCKASFSGSLHPSVTSALTTTLANYNEGAIGPGHCG